jgi:hypothetical protein
MKLIVTAISALFGASILSACESAGEHYDGVSRFAGSAPYYGPGSPPREEVVPPKIPGVNDQAGQIPQLS